MGIQKEPAAFIASLVSALPRGFSVCELGDQGMCGEPTKRLAKDWYQELGCGRYVSIDGNGRATVTADLNISMTPELQAALDPFDLVTDFGTGEHIFDQAQVWRTMHALVKPGGYIAFDRPSAGYERHCFYITNECLYRDLAQANHYSVVWFDRAQTKRGELMRGIFQRPETTAPFRVPYQSKYVDSLVIAR